MKMQIGRTTIDFELFTQVKNHLIQLGKIGKGSTASEVVRAAFELIKQDRVIADPEPSSDKSNP